MGIELRLSDVEPPEPDPPRTIYRDVVNLPDPVLLGLTIRYFNYDAVTLYFQITGSGVGYTFDTVNLGSLGSGANRYQNLDEFASRAKPSAGDFTAGELVESITLILRAYTDAEYTDLKWTHERTVGVIFIKSDDPAFTQDVLNDFDDGTVQGWAVAKEAGDVNPTIAVVTDYVLSAPYSVKMTMSHDGYPVRDRLYKSFTTPNKDVVYAIIDVRVSKTGVKTSTENLKIQRNTATLVYLGGPAYIDTVNLVPINKWLRIVVPLPKNTILELRIVLQLRIYALEDKGYLWLDDFKIVSK